jgi:hypothetical protein
MENGIILKVKIAFEISLYCTLDHFPDVGKMLKIGGHNLWSKISTSSLITVIFTKRDNKIRVISARPMSQKERRFYENYTKV